jgi:hypothetical protein
MRRTIWTAKLSRRTCLAALATAGLMATATGALAQVAQPRDAPPVGVGEVPRAASPAGARYIPGVGYRFVTPPGPRVYGYYAGPRVYGWYDDRESRRYGYRARRVGCDPLGEIFDRRCARR